MTLQKIGGLASLTCAATYLVGFAFLVTVLAPLGYGTTEIDARAVVAFIDRHPSFLILWNSVIYVLNALALTVLVVALHSRLKAGAPHWAEVIRALGLIWSTLVLGAGMIGNVAVERAAHVFPSDAARAADIWDTLHAVELGLGGGNEIAGGVWILLVGLAALIGRGLGKIAIGLGLVTGLAGLLTVIPALGDAAGAVFGLGAIAWFIVVGLSLTFTRSTQI